MDSHPTLIVGLGETGLSCARYLAAQGEAIAVMDSRHAPPALERLRLALPRVPIHLGGFENTLLEGAREIILSPGVSLQEPAIGRARAKGIPVVGDIELFARALEASDAKAPVIAITGSNGKSTVTSLVAEMARMEGLTVGVGGNLGPPALDLLAGEKTDIFVLELSSFQLETTETLAPLAATVLNISEDHGDRYTNQVAYVAAKRRIFRGTGAMVLNLDDPMVTAMAEEAGDRNMVGFRLAPPSALVPQENSIPPVKATSSAGVSPGKRALENEFGIVERTGGAWIAHGTTPLLPIAKLGVQGMHNVANALAALTLGRIAGLSLAAMRQALREFSGLSHRCQWVADQDGVRWLNDSKATNVGATVAAIRGFGGRQNIVLIAGGDGKNADFRPLGTAVCGPVRAMVLMGQDAGRIEDAVGDAVPITRAENMPDAVQKARALTHPGDSVLLSPACASWDQYRDYQDRGERFAAAVRSMGAAHGKDRAQQLT